MVHLYNNNLHVMNVMKFDAFFIIIHLHESQIFRHSIKSVKKNNVKEQ
jgi:hypothetical protein